MADHSTIILFPLLVILLTSGAKVLGSSQDNSFFKKSSEALMARARESKITIDQQVSINHMVRFLNDKTNKIVNGQTLEEITANVTAVREFAKIVEQDLQIYNNFVVHTLGLTKEDLKVTEEVFCKAVPKICNETYKVPENLKVPEDLTGKPAPQAGEGSSMVSRVSGKEEVEVLHKDHKEIVNATAEQDKMDEKQETVKLTLLTKDTTTTVLPSLPKDHTIWDHMDLNSASKPSSGVWTLTAVILLVAAFK